MTETYKVLVSDELPESGLTPLQADANLTVDIRTTLTPDQLIEAIPAYDALIVRSSTQVTAAVIQAGKRLRVVARAGVGVDNIDTKAATQAGVIVVNAPTGNTVAAAEHTIALLMALARNIPQAYAHVHTGQWKRNRFVGTEVRDKILGTVGLGRVAQEVAQMAQGLGMRVLAYDPYVTAEYAAQRGVTLADLDTLLAESDFVTLHTPLTPQTRHLLNKERLLSMKQGARILNVARGGVLDEQALVEVINEGHLAGAALDVFETEPLAADSPLRTSDKIILTPHLGASTVEAQEKVAEDVALQVLDVLNGRPARYAVNAPIIPPKDLEFLIPYIDLAERMGRFLKQLGAQGVGDVELIAHGDLANFDLAYIKAGVIQGLLADVLQVRVNLVNANLIAERRGLNLMESKRQQSDAPYETMLSLSATSGTQRWTVRGTVLQGEVHIVAINDLWVDIVAVGNFLLTGHQDRPGIIGRVGTLLGQSDINISFMHVGRRAPRAEAIMVLGTDEVASPALLATIEAMPDIIWLKAITL
ncbi:MAG: phosphoglycerate dehydrogenase [Chloroflexi bacterium]|nr:phosphoglycerate dehydrogenase [Chloroflexota bacterium]